MPTAISWTDETWNPTRGCRPVSPGCANCYAQEQAAAVNRRFRGLGKPEPYAGLVEIRGKGERPMWTGAGRFASERLGDPLRWRAPLRVFVDSMSDLFFEEFSNEQIAAVFGVMAAAPQHTFQVLTKRPERMLDWFRWVEEQGDRSPCIREAYCWLAGNNEGLRWASMLSPAVDGPWPLPNVWLGVSVENQKVADDRIPVLLETPAAVRFLSMEPLLEDVSIWAFLKTTLRDESLAALGSPPMPGIDWVIAGAESGARARPAAFPWFRNLRDQCAAARVPFFLKQAERTPGFYISGELAVAQRREVCEVVSIGDGSHRKRGGIIELPYLDGVQHAAFPEAARAE